MILQNNLYSIISHQQGIPATFHVRIHPEWPVYEAHFPGHPVTPGVCIVQMVQELLQEHMHRKLTLCSAKNVKYLAIISPEEVAELTVSFQKLDEQPDGSLKVQAQVEGNETLFTKLSVTFR